MNGNCSISGVIHIQHLRFHVLPIKWAKITKAYDIKAQQEYGGKNLKRTVHRITLEDNLITSTKYSHLFPQNVIKGAKPGFASTEVWFTIL